MRVFRLDVEKDKCRPARLEGDGWVLGQILRPWPLYRLDELAQATMVVVVEGEKAADAIASIGITVTTSPQRSGPCTY